MIKSYLIIFAVLSSFAFGNSYAASSKTDNKTKVSQKKSVKKSAKKKNVKRKYKKRSKSTVNISALTSDEVHAKYFQDNEYIPLDSDLGPSSQN